MAIVNRDKDVSEQRRLVSCQVKSAITGQTYPLCVIANQSKLVAANEASYGVSGSPVHSIWLYRFVAGAGITSTVLGSTIAVAAYGVSGAQTFSVSAAGASNLLQAGDELVLFTQGANSATDVTVVGLAIQALQDIQTQFGA